MAEKSNNTAVWVTVVIIIIILIALGSVAYFMWGPGKTQPLPPPIIPPPSTTPPPTSTPPPTTPPSTPPSTPPQSPPSSSVPSSGTTTLTNPVYQDPSWSLFQSNAFPTGYVTGTNYDSYASSASECANLIQSKASTANDSNVVGWTWVSSPTTQGNCRAVTKTNTQNFCINPSTPPTQAYVGNTAITYYHMGPCN